MTVSIYWLHGFDANQPKKQKFLHHLILSTSLNLDIQYLALECHKKR